MKSWQGRIVPGLSSISNGHCNGPQGVKMACYVISCFLILNILVNDPKALSQESKWQEHHKVQRGMWSISLFLIPKIARAAQGQREEGPQMMKVFQGQKEEDKGMWSIISLLFALLLLVCADHIVSLWSHANSTATAMVPSHPS